MPAWLHPRGRRGRSLAENTRNNVAVHLKARPYVFDCKYEKPFETDVHLRVLEAFRKHAIQPPAILHRGIDDPRTSPPRAGEKETPPRAAGAPR
jgi:hypothetical protein